MDSILLNIKSEEKEFFLNLVEKFNFITVRDYYPQELKAYYDEQIEKAEEDIKTGK